MIWAVWVHVEEWGSDFAVVVARARELARRRVMPCCSHRPVRASTCFGTTWSAARHSRGLLACSRPKVIMKQPMKQRRNRIPNRRRSTPARALRRSRAVADDAEARALVLVTAVLLAFGLAVLYSASAIVAVDGGTAARTTCSGNWLASVSGFCSRHRRQARCGAVGQVGVAAHGTHAGS